MNKNRRNRGISAIEMTTAVAIASIAILSVSGVLADSQRGWNVMYGRVYSDVFTNGHMVKRMFDSIVRKSSNDELQIDPDGDWVEVCYYQDDSSTELDQYTRFFYQDNALHVEHGRLDPRETTSINTVCSNVTSCVFKRSGRSVHMMLTLNNGSQTLTVGSSAKTHN
ncbi:MAG: hypothetical protein ABII09_12645 [Planctomycetota bacterium]